jgi:hypothetical protein
MKLVGFILSVFAMLHCLPTLSAQEILELGEYGKVEVIYMLISERMGDAKARQISKLNETVDMNEYPDGKLKIKVKVLELKDNHIAYLGPKSFPDELHGFIKTGSYGRYLRKKDEQVLVNYQYAPDRLGKGKSFLAVTVFLKDNAGNIIGDRNGYHAKGQNYTLISPKSKEEEVSPPKSVADKEAEVWEKAQAQNSIAGYQAFLNAFPNGLYAREARTRIQHLTSLPNKSAELNPAQIESGSTRNNSTKSDSQTGDQSPDSLSAIYSVAQNGDLHIQILGGHPPFELRFLKGDVYVGIIKFGAERDIHLTREKILADKIPFGIYQLKVYDKFGNPHHAAAYPQPYELANMSSTRPSWILIVLAIGLVFVAGYYLGGKRGG